MNGVGFVFLCGFLVGVWFGITWEPQLSDVSTELYRSSRAAPATH